MKAVVVEHYGPYQDIQVSELSDPQPGEGEIVIAVEASDVNFPDILHVEGKYQVKMPLPFSPGLGAAGSVIAVGKGVSDFQPGQKVLTLPTHGTHAEKVAVRANYCFPVPEDVPSDVAAALGLVYQTSYFALTARGQLKAGDRVLVLGATGGVGMAAIQLARAMGARQVIGVTRGENKAALVRDFGADAVIDASVANLRDHIRDAVRDLTDGHGADIVIDPVGSGLADAAVRALAWEGRYVVIGFAGGNIPTFKANYLLVKNIAALGLQWTDYRDRDLPRVRAAQAEIFDLWRADRLDPHISGRFPLTAAAAALSTLERGEARGKILLIP